MTSERVIDMNSETMIDFVGIPKERLRRQMRMFNREKSQNFWSK
jgi:hypothetical protein